MQKQVAYCFIEVDLLNLRDLRDLPISEGDIVGTKRCV